MRDASHMNNLRFKIDPHTINRDDAILQGVAGEINIRKAAVALPGVDEHGSPRGRGNRGSRSGHGSRGGRGGRACGRGGVDLPG
jgi:hypothetical protein